MLAQITAFGIEKQDGAVERAAIALDDADHQVDGMLTRGFGQEIHGGTRDIDSAFEIAPEHAAAFGRPPPDARAEVESFGISGYERFWKHHQSRALRGSARGKYAYFFKRGFAVENYRRGLHHSGSE